MPQPCKCVAYALFLLRKDTHPYYLQPFVARFEAVAVFNILKKNLFFLASNVFLQKRFGYDKILLK